MNWIYEKTKHKSSNTPWADIILRAMADGERMSNLRMITLKSYYEDQVSQQININDINNTLSEEKILNEMDKKLHTLMDSGNVKVKQFVEYSEVDNQLTVCLDVDSINDITFTRALDTALGVDLSNGKVEFGSAETFTYDQIYSKKDKFNTIKRMA